MCHPAVIEPGSAESRPASAREPELIELGEEVEDVRGVNRRDVPAERIERRQCAAFIQSQRWGRGAGRWGGDLEEGGVEGVACDEGHREGLGRRLEELMAERP